MDRNLELIEVVFSVMNWYEFRKSDDWTIITFHLENDTVMNIYN